jgi:hypothetical protein
MICLIKVTLRPQLMEKAIPIFEACFPGCQALFLFDNSSNHDCFSSDALVAARMNLGPGAGQRKTPLPCMRDTFFGPDNTLQPMVFPFDHPKYPGEPKGIMHVLRDRGLFNPALRLDCDDCRKKRSHDPGRHLRTDCCHRRVMATQPDFLAQRSGIQEAVEDAGHLFGFYPKFHCELNYIEMYWGAAKRFARENCAYDADSLRRIVPLALDSVSLPMIRRFARKSFRYMDAYRKGLYGHLAEFAVKKHHSHRRVPEKTLDKWEEEYEEHERKKKERKERERRYRNQ